MRLARQADMRSRDNLNASPSVVSRIVQRWLSSSNTALGPVSEDSAAALISHEGVPQGDPLAPFLFALCLHGGITRFREQFPHSELRIWAFVDDLTLALPSHMPAADLEGLYDCLAGAGLAINHTKTQVWTPTLEPPAVQDLRRIWEKQEEKQGITLCGHPVDRQEPG